MADNVTLPGTGSVVATDQVSGTHYQLVKLAYGALDSATLVTSSAGLPVSVANASLAITAAALPLPSGAATESTLSTLSGKVTACDTGAVVVASALPAGTNNIGDVDVLTLPSLPAGTNAIGKLAANDGVDIGDVTINNASLAVTGTFWQATQPVSGTLAATQSGTWNVGTVTTVTGITNVVHVDDNSGSLTVDGTVAATQSGTWTVQPGNTANTTAWKVDASSVAVPITDNAGSLTVDNGGTFAVQATVAAGATSIAKAEDVASADADVGVPAMAVRKATPANTSGTDGDYEMLQVSAGRLWASATIDAALPAGTSLIGKVSGGLDTASVYSGTTALTPKFAAISTASSGNTTVVAAVVSKKIRVLSYRFQTAADVDVKFRDNTAAVDLTGAMSTGAKGGGGGAAFSPVGHFETASGNALSINLSSAVQVSGHITYIEV
jgi:hypothetical protein